MDNSPADQAGSWVKLFAICQTKRPNKAFWVRPVRPAGVTNYLRKLLLPYWIKYTASEESSFYNSQSTHNYQRLFDNFCPRLGRDHDPARNLKLLKCLSICQMSDGLTLSPDFVVMATSTCKYYWFNGEGLPANVHMLAWSRLASVCTTSSYLPWRPVWCIVIQFCWNLFTEFCATQYKHPSWHNGCLAGGWPSAETKSKPKTNIEAKLCAWPSYGLNFYPSSQRARIADSCSACQAGICIYTSIYLYRRKGQVQGSKLLLLGVSENTNKIISS